jgi:hypothetical protein
MNLVNIGGRRIKPKRTHQIVGPGNNGHGGGTPVGSQKAGENEFEHLWWNPVRIINQNNHSLAFTNLRFRPAEKVIYNFPGGLSASQARQSQAFQVAGQRKRPSQGGGRDTMEIQAGRLTTHQFCQQAGFPRAFCTSQQQGHVAKPTEVTKRFQRVLPHGVWEKRSVQLQRIRPQAVPLLQPWKQATAILCS